MEVLKAILLRLAIIALVVLAAYLFYVAPKQWPGGSLWEIPGVLCALGALACFFTLAGSEQE